MKPFQSYIILILTVLLLSSCKKVPVILPDLQQDSGCEAAYRSRTQEYTQHIAYMALPQCISSLTYIPLNQYVFFEQVVNPSNPYEFAILRRVIGTSPYNNDLCIYNFCDNSFRVVAGGVAFGLDWSTTDWLIFTGHDGNLRKVKSDGTELTFLHGGQSARWSPDGSKYFYHDPASGSLKRFINHADGSLYHQINRGMRFALWLNEDELVFSTPLDLKIYRISDQSETLLASFDGIGVINAYKRGSLLYLNLSNQIYTYNLETSELKLVFDHYESFRASNVQPISDDWLLLTRTISDTTHYLSQCTIYTTGYVSLYNVHSGEERWISYFE
jgi:hypothetical protein